MGRRHKRHKHKSHKHHHHKPKRGFKVPWLNVIIVLIVIIAVSAFIFENNPTFQENMNKLDNFFSSYEVEETPKEKETVKEEDNSPNAIQRFIEDLKPEERNVAVIEDEIHKLVNEERSRNRKRSLSKSSRLDDFARKWSDKLIKEGTFYHSNLGFSGNNYAGENIGQVPIHSSVTGCGSTHSNQAIAECFVKGWIESKGHHENMLNGKFSSTGIGVSCDSYECKATQVFKG